MLASTVLVLSMCSAPSYSDEVQAAILEATEFRLEQPAFETSYAAEVQAAILEAVEVWK